MPTGESSNRRRGANTISIVVAEDDAANGGNGYGTAFLPGGSTTARSQRVGGGGGRGNSRLSRRKSALDIEVIAESAHLPALPAVIAGKEPRHYTRSELRKMGRYESVNTFEQQTTIHKDHLEYRSREPRWFIWVFVAVVGVLTAAVAVLLVSSLHTLFAVRMRLLQLGLMGFSTSPVPPIYDNDGAVTSSQSAVFSGQDVHLFGLPEQNLGGGFAMYILFTLAMSSAAALICALVPDAIGPGGPEVIAYLNGVENESFADTRVFVAKFFATLFTIASGVPLGFYGTLAQAGTMVGTSLLTRSRWVRFDSVRIIACFRNPRDRRIITVIGAACGFASAFSVSIGGLMIVMEQLSSIFPVRFALYVFVSSLIASLAMQTYFSYLTYFGDRDRAPFSTGELISEVLIQFDTKIHKITPVPMNVLVFLPSIFLGIVCGFLSALFVRLHGLALNLRRRAEVKYKTKSLRYVVPVVIALLYSTVVFWISAGFGNNAAEDASGYGCQALAPNGTILITRNVSVVSFYGMSGAMCKPYVFNRTNGGNVYVPPELLPGIVLGGNQTASYYAPPQIHTYGSIAFGFADSTLQFLLSWRTGDVVPAGIVAVFGVVYFFFSAFASGVSLTGDVMLPAMVIGGCVGRLVGIGVHELWGQLGMASSTDMWTDPGVFALIGAGCFLGGITGMTFSICVILTEITNDFRHTLPLMLGISIAKRIAERYAHNMNTTYLEDRSVPLLDFDARIHKYDMFSAKHVMTPFVTTLNTVGSIGDVLTTLTGCNHHAFPITSVRDGTYKGIVLREQVVLYLWHLYFTDSHHDISIEQVQRVEDRLFYDEDLFDDDEGTEGHRRNENGGGSDEAGTPTPAGGRQRLDSPSHRHSLLLRRSSTVMRGALSAEGMPPPPFEDFWLNDRIDLSAHVDQSGFCVMDSTSLSRTYHLFRTLGLRHLVVVNKENRIVGIITRKDLITHNILVRITEANTERKRLLRLQRQQAREQGLAQEDDSASSSDTEHDSSRSTPAGPYSPHEPLSFAGSARKKARKWIVAGEIDDGDGAEWSGGGLGSMHPVMLPIDANPVQTPLTSTTGREGGSGMGQVRFGCPGTPVAAGPTSTGEQHHKRTSSGFAQQWQETPHQRRGTTSSARVEAMLRQIPSLDNADEQSPASLERGGPSYSFDERRQQNVSSTGDRTENEDLNNYRAFSGTASLASLPPAVPRSKKFASVLKMSPSLGTTDNNSFTPVSRSPPPPGEPMRPPSTGGSQAAELETTDGRAADDDDDDIDGCASPRLDSSGHDPKDSLSNSDASSSRASSPRRRAASSSSDDEAVDVACVRSDTQQPSDGPLQPTRAEAPASAAVGEGSNLATAAPPCHVRDGASVSINRDSTNSSAMSADAQPLPIVELDEQREGKESEKSNKGKKKKK